MKANEFRLGNLINDRGRVVVFESYHFNIIESYYKEDFKPIPLTEEWLLKFGFEWHGLGNKWLTKFTPSGKALVSIENEFFKFTGVVIEIQIQHVHQLQNLYFALTGEELTLNS